MTHKSSFGFTLIELLIVIGIIGVLSGVLIGQFGGLSESAKAAKCMANMRALATAAMNYAMSDGDGYFPRAGSYECRSRKYVTEMKGWVSWVHDKNAYSGEVTTHKASPSWTWYAVYDEEKKQNRDDAAFALSNGVVWAHAGRSAEVFVCPKHLEACRKKNLTPAWSYVMNSYFGYDTTQGAGIRGWQGVSVSGLVSGSAVLGADKVLLFAELPFAEIEAKYGTIQDSIDLEGKTAAYDCVLQYNARSPAWSGTPESIGFNHRSGRSYHAHVAFADGHVASMALPREATKEDIRNLTTWLCQGDDIAFLGDRYERTNQANKNTN